MDAAKERREDRMEENSQQPRTKEQETSRKRHKGANSVCDSVREEEVHSKLETSLGSTFTLGQGEVCF